MKPQQSTPLGASRRRALARALALFVLLGTPLGAALAEHGHIRLDDPQYGDVVGLVEWSHHDLSISGTLSSGERGASLWLSWSAGGFDYYELLQALPPEQDATFKHRFGFRGTPTKITLTLCDDNPGEGCGAQQRF